MNQQHLHASHPEDAALEQRLRELPGPSIPSGLEERLIAGIPAPVVAAGSEAPSLLARSIGHGRGLGLFLAGAAAMAAVVTLAVLLVKPSASSNDTATDVLLDTSAQLVLRTPDRQSLLKDTDPCRILPNRN